MQIIRREFLGVKPTDVFRIYPLGDLHLGARACDEDRLRRVVQSIAKDPHAYWIGMGDYIEAINRFDKRFDPLAVAEWVSVSDLVDLGRAQVSYALDVLKPIAHKCLCLLEGNHEETLRRIHERDVYGDIVSGIKTLAKLPSETPLRLDYTGYLLLSFFRTKRREDGSRRLTFNLHHGAGGSGKPGAKVNALREWLLTHDCDVAVWGHSHLHEYTEAYVESAESGRPIVAKRYGVIASSFLQSGVEGFVSYSERKAYAPLGIGRSVIETRPTSEAEDRIRVTSW